MQRKITQPQKEWSPAMRDDLDGSGSECTKWSKPANGKGCTVWLTGETQTPEQPRNRPTATEDKLTGAKGGEDGKWLEEKKIYDLEQGYTENNVTTVIIEVKLIL